MRDESTGDPEPTAFEDALRAISGSAALQVRFLNTLSLLEYVGARKILKSQPEETISLQLLTHAAEELRHARALKRVAERLNDERSLGYSADETLCGLQAKAYFQNLDDQVDEGLGSAGPRLTYLYETLLIEERAVWAYPRIGAALQSEWVSGVLRGILVEEVRHLSEIVGELETSDPAYQGRASSLRSVEASLFAAFATALRDAPPATSALI
jgi:hypothetical protein